MDESEILPMYPSIGYWTQRREHPPPVLLTGKEKIVTVTTTPTLILSINPGRTEYILQNQSSITVYLGITSSVSTSGTRKGRELAAGGLESANKQENPGLIKQQLYGVVISDSADIWVWEA